MTQPAPMVTRGIIFGILATAVFAGQDAISKHLASSYPIVLFVMIRYWAFAAFATTVSVRRTGSFAKAMASHHPFLQILRGLLLVAEIGVFAWGLRYVDIATMHAIFMSNPLIVTALSALFLGEDVRWRRWAAVLVGFVGVLIIIRPGIRGFEPGMWIALLSALMFAVYTLLTRVVTQRDSTATTFLYTGIVGAVASSLIGPFYWMPMTPADQWWMALLCITGMTGHWFLIKALELAPASTLQPFNYLSMVWAIPLGWFAFGEMPDGPTILGAVIIMAAGLYIIMRERARAR